MRLRVSQQFDYTNAVVAGLVWVSSLAIYCLTVAPTLSFWDCGEFIAASHILGIPHPPGTPLYILFGRLFTLLPFWDDVSLRVNMLSAVCSSITAVFGYLIVVRFLRIWFGSETGSFARMLIYAGGASGALLAAFGLTNWTNSVEAEVYGMAMMLMLAVIWLTLIYREQSGTAPGYRVMALTVFLGILGIGVHMTVFVAVLFAGLFFVIKKSAPVETWYLIAVFVLFELYLIFALSSRVNEIPYFVPVIVVGILYFFYIFSFERVPRVQLLVGFGFLVAAMPLFSMAAANLGSSSDGVADLSRGSSMTTYIGVGVLALMTIWAIVVVLRWVNRRTKVGGSFPALAPAGFVIAASIAVVLLHIPKGLIPFLILSSLVVCGLLFVLRRQLHWSFLIALLGISLIVVGLKLFFIGVLTAMIVIIGFGLTGRLSGWKPAVALLVCAVIGFSVHLFVPIRSAQQPNINENNPSESLTATIGFLERKQYGAQNMLARMFQRRAEWINQFGDYRRMGFWRFFKQQYGMPGPASLMLVFVGVFGIWEIVRRRPRIGLPFVVLLLIVSVGLILYMNFADGTRQHPRTGMDYLEVRDRDYFFTPAFILFGMAVGIGLTAFVQTIRRSTVKFTTISRQAIPGMAMMLFLVPTITVANNYHYCDRSGNVIPYDYGCNLLESMPPNGILLTHGDNDTFPLWCLQEVYGLRPDVSVVNLSLSNTRWYIKQLQMNMGLDLGWTDAEIDQLRSIRTADGRVFRLQDLVIDALVDRYAQERPVCFSVTVGSGTRRYRGRKADSILSLKGLVWQVSQTQQPLEVDVDASVSFFLDPDRFRARGVNDPSIHQDEATLRLTRNYGNAFLVVADTIRKAGDLEKAAELARMAVEKIPHAGDPVTFLASIYESQGKVDEILSLIDETWAGDRRLLETTLARAYRGQENDTAAEETLNSLLASDPTYRPAFEELMRLYFENQRMANMRQLMQSWLQFNPADKRVREMLKELQGKVQSGIPADEVRQ
ncbi:MAG: DUF2723 domain-containing protein [candidate division Zixibacteria bacterium]|nr:DUF2723 domain-containing protein [candidate division Zixibacteria bacterium]